MAAESTRAMPPGETDATFTYQSFSVTFMKHSKEFQSCSHPNHVFLRACTGAEENTQKRPGTPACKIHAKTRI